MPHFRTILARRMREHGILVGGRRVRYGMGCAWIGKAPEAEARATLDAAYAAGYRYFDTSAAYGDSERWLGGFLDAIDRDSVLLASKSRVRGETPEAAADSVRTSIERSLQRLRTDRIDLLQLHDVQSLKHVLADGGVVEVLRQARAAGRIGHYGLATRFHVLLEQATHHGGFETILTFSDFTPIDDAAKMVIALAARRGLGVINASPLCSGLLAGGDPRRTNAGRRSPRRCAIALRFLDFCRRRDVSPIAAALQFPLRQCRIDMNLTGPATPGEVAAGVAALGAELPEDFWRTWRAEAAAADVAPSGLETATPTAPEVPGRLGP